MKDHYDVLELEKNCTAKEIKDSYIKLSKKYHPDKNKSKDAEKRILEINEAYSVLRNTSARYRYDEGLKRGNVKQQQTWRSSHQNSGGYYYRPYTYDDFVRYRQNMRGQPYTESSLLSRKFTVVFCCCMLMVIGAGLRIMYARSEAHQRKKINEMTAKSILQSQNRVNPKVEKLRRIFQERHKHELEKKKSDS